MLNFKVSQNADKDRNLNKERKKKGNNKGWFIAFFDVELSKVRSKYFC